MTVIEHCEDSSVEVQMPDNIKVKISQNGSYKLELQNKEIIDINRKKILINIISCIQCNAKSDCKINVGPYKKKFKNLRSQDSFLSILDRENKLINIDFGGHLTEEFVSEGSSLSSLESFGKCKCEKVSQARYFVLKRDLSGSELFNIPKQSKFICTLDIFDSTKYPDPDNNSTSYIKHLYKNYTEHLMNLYDMPVFGIINTFAGAEEVFKYFDYDQNSVLALRTPIYVMERTIYHLRLYKLLESLIFGFRKYIQKDEKYKKLKPTDSLLAFIQENTPVIKLPDDIIQPIFPEKPKKPYVSKRKTLQERRREAELILQEPIPKYFHSKKGQMFLHINKCLETAMDISYFNEIVNTPRIHEPLPSPYQYYKGMEEEDYEIKVEEEDKVEEEVFKPPEFGDPNMCKIDDKTGVCLGEVTDEEITQKPNSQEITPVSQVTKISSKELNASSNHKHESSDSKTKVEVKKVTSDKLKCGHDKEKINLEKKTSTMSTKQGRSVYCVPSFCCPEAPKPSQVTCYVEDEVPSIDDSGHDAHSNQIVNERYIALDIVHALYEKAPGNDMKLLSKENIAEILFTKLQGTKFKKEHSSGIIKAVESILLKHNSEGKNLLKTAQNVIQEVKNRVSTTAAIKEVKTSSSTVLVRGPSDSGRVKVPNLEDISIKASCIIYNILENPEAQIMLQGIQEMEKLIKDSNLSAHEINLVLELTAKGFQRDFKGSDLEIILDGQNKVMEIPSATANNIIENLEQVTALLSKSGAHLFEEGGSHKAKFTNVHKKLPHSKTKIPDAKEKRVKKFETKIDSTISNTAVYSLDELFLDKMGDIDNNDDNDNDIISKISSTPKRRKSKKGSISEKSAVSEGRRPSAKANPQYARYSTAVPIKDVSYTYMKVEENI